MNTVLLETGWDTVNSCPVNAKEGPKAKIQQLPATYSVLYAAHCNKNFLRAGGQRGEPTWLVKAYMN